MSETLYVKILDKEYQVACPPGQENALHSAAKNLDTLMRSIRSNSSVIGLERIAVMAALNLSHELLQAKDNALLSAADTETIQRLTDKVDQTLKGLQ